MKAYDPRDIITPDAFSLAPDLLGIRLAHPWRRLAAFGIDALFVTLIAQTSLVILIALVCALLLWRAVSPGSSASLTGRTTRIALRLLIALFAFILVLKLWDTIRPERRAEPAAVMSGIGTGAPPPPAAGVPDVGGSADAGAGPTPAVAGPAADSIVADTGDADSVALALAAENAQLRERNRALEARLQRDEEDSGPVRAFFAEMIDELGLGLGWFGFYFIVLTVLGRGQTPGKRLLGIRVIRLDAAPIGWWIALERFGGYAASFFSGLLGFAQLLWDRNRQALHDKATGTVVVRVIAGEPVRSPAAGISRPRA
jgi:uncharacterized RDD family membrane protein YckC